MLAASVLDESIDAVAAFSMAWEFQLEQTRLKEHDNQRNAAWSPWRLQNLFLFHEYPRCLDRPVVTLESGLCFSVVPFALVCASALLFAFWYFAGEISCVFPTT